MLDGALPDKMSQKMQSLISSESCAYCRARSRAALVLLHRMPGCRLILSIYRLLGRTASSNGPKQHREQTSWRTTPPVISCTTKSISPEWAPVNGPDRSDTLM